MSGAVISSNVSLKVSNKVGASRATTGVLYTCPADSYAEVQLATKGGTDGSWIEFDLDGFPIARATTNATTGSFFTGQSSSGPATALVPALPSIKIGSGQVLSVTTGGGGTPTAYVTGVVLINSP